MSAKAQRVSHQIAWVFDLNKCSGCQTCSVACKVHWTLDDETEPMWWCTVNTQPGRGTPRDYEKMGGGYDGAGKPVLGHLPTPEEFGEAWDFNWKEIYFGGKGQQAFLEPSNVQPTWGMNWAILRANLGMGIVCNQTLPGPRRLARNSPSPPSSTLPKPLTIVTSKFTVGSIAARWPVSTLSCWPGSRRS